MPTIERLYVRLPRKPINQHDPVEVLIHELLHHVVPALPHHSVYPLAAELRALDAGALLPRFVRVEGKEDTNGIGDWMAGISEESALEFVEHLWLEAAGLIKHPRRSPLTGRFLKRGA